MKKQLPHFDFDDVLIVAKTKTHINSRYDDIQLPDKLPLFTAPMDTVVDLNNFELFMESNLNITLPRTVKYSDIVLRDVIHKNVFISFGFSELDELGENNFDNLYSNAHILIDVANGHMKKVIDYAKKIKKLRPDIVIMTGNIANPETYEWYCKNNCIDYVRVGIGNGGGCLTTKQSGIGYPMASLIQEIYEVKKKFIENNSKIKPPTIVADGGMKDYSDIIKALALGADYVMIGSIFNKAFESCADNYLFKIKLNNKLAKYFFDRGYPVKKYFRGMSTKQAQKAMGKSTLKTSEGVVRYRNVEYYLNSWVENFEHYLRNAMSYSDAKTLTEFIGNANICQITKSAYDRFNK
ncbi:IMP dehydrogenase [Candidatus Dojkabacteria bacterium]|jgi:hypothetical protein|nr:IMP dehydrogenase [Candidatus Dojkabacteria bacterium]